MISRRFRSLLSMVVVGSLLGMSSPVFSADYVIGAGDVLAISVLGNTELDTVGAVNPGGKISVPLVGDVQAAGLTAEELADHLSRELGKKIKNPVVTVSLREINSYRIYVLGRVTKPGVISSKSEITLLQALALAGDLAPGADMTLAYVARGNKRVDVNFRKLLREGDLSQNILLKPEDVVVVPASPSNSVFVMGEVNKPGSFPLNQGEGFTIMQAIAGAGGFSQFAKPSGTVVIRVEGTQKQIISVDVDEIIENPREAKDIPLKPGDVVFVPQGGLF